MGFHVLSTFGLTRRLLILFFIKWLKIILEKNLKKIQGVFKQIISSQWRNRQTPSNICLINLLSFSIN